MHNHIKSFTRPLCLHLCGTVTVTVSVSFSCSRLFIYLCLFPGLSLSRCTCSSDRIFVKDEVEERFVLFHDIHYPPKVYPKVSRKSVPQNEVSMSKPYSSVNRISILVVPLVCWFLIQRRAHHNIPYHHTHIHVFASCSCAISILRDVFGCISPCSLPVMSLFSLSCLSSTRLFSTCLSSPHLSSHLF